VAARRDHQRRHRRRGRVVAQGPAEVRAVHDRHLVVGDQQVRRPAGPQLPADGRQGLGAVAGRRHHRAGPAELERQDLRQVRLVIDHQDGATGQRSGS